MSVAFAYSASVNDASPVIIGDLIFVSASYEIGAAVVRVQGSDCQELWSSDEVLSNHYATSLYYDGNLYGFHGRLEYNPSFRAVALNSGKVLGSEDCFGAAR